METLVAPIGRPPDAPPASVPAEDVLGQRVQAPPESESPALVLKKRADMLWSDVEDAHRALAARHEREESYLKGAHFLDIDPRTHEVYEMRPSKKFAHVNNQYAGFVDAAVAAISAEEGKLIAKCRTRDRTKRSRLRDIQHWLDGDRPFTALDVITEAYFLKTRGQVWYHTTPRANGPEQQIPRFGTTTMGGGPPAFMCHDCGAGGYLDASTTGIDAQPDVPAPDGGPAPMGGAPGAPPAPQMGMGAPHGTAPGAASPHDGAACPQCGSTAIEIVEGAPETDIPTVEGYDAQPSVKAYTEVVDDLEMRWYFPKKEPRRSPWLERFRLVMEGDILEAFPWAEGLLPAGSGAPGPQSSNMGAWLQDRLSSQVGAATPNVYAQSRMARSRGSRELRREFREIWFRPSEYRKTKLARPVEWKNRQKPPIPAGVELGKVFPKGLYMAWCGDVCLEMRGCSIDDEWDYLPHKVNPSGGPGRGSEDLLSLQDRLNIEETYGLVGLVTEAAGVLLFNENKVSAQKIKANVGNPGSAIGISGLLPNETIERNVVHRLGPGGMSVDPSARARDTMASMQGLNATYVTSPRITEDGGGGNNLETATGVNRLAESIRRLNEPMTKLLKAVRASVAEKRLRIMARYTIEDYVEARDPLGRDAGRTISFAELGDEYYVEPDPDAYMTRSNADKRTDLVAGIQAGAWLMDVHPDQQRAIRRTFGLDELADDGYLVTQELSYSRIEAMRDAAESLWPIVERSMQQIDAAMQQATSAGMAPPVDPATGQPVDFKAMAMDGYAQEIASIDEIDERDMHAVYIETYIKDWPLPETQNGNPLFKRATLLAFQARKQAEQMFAVQDQMQQMEAAAPLMAAEAGMQDQQAEAEHERGERSADAQAERQLRADDQKSKREQQAGPPRR
jgi:hypothetical protein